MTIGVEHFNWMCRTAAGTVIAPDLLIPLLSDADIERIVYDPSNRNISASRRRRFSAAMRRIIEVRDQHCQHPSGCDEPAARCDVDHVIAHGDGGITCICNGQLLCAFHNRTVKAAADLANRTQRPTPPAPPRSGDPLPCPHDHQPTWTATDGDTANDNTDSRAPPQTG